MNTKVAINEASQNQNTREILSVYLKSIDGLKSVESLISEKLASQAFLLTDISKYLLELGGKRIRPALCLIMAKALGLKNPSKELVQVAAGIELIHMATLLHDDIIDNSRLRRHKASPLQKFGMNNTLLTGDFLLVRAFSLCAHLDEFIIDKTEVACVELTEGEILETALCHEKHSIESSLLIARKKTAALFRLSCETAAHLSSLDTEIVQLAAGFGENLGIAFQILDDVLDVVSDDDTLGKQCGSDIQERKPSLINVLWLQSGSATAQQLRQVPSSDESDFVKKGLAELRGVDMNGSEIVRQAKSMAQQYAASAASCLNQIEKRTVTSDPEALLALKGLVAYCIERME